MIKRILNKFQNFWLEDVSFIALFLMLFTAIFIIPSVMEYSESGVLILNVILLGLFFSGIFSSSNKFLIALSSTLFLIHLTLRIIRFTDNPYSYYLAENFVAITNIVVFIYINLRLLFRDNSVGLYRIIGAVNVYLLIALFGAISFEIIHILTGESLLGVINLSGTDIDYEHYIYFSLTSLTTVGFGDISPANAAAKMMSTLLSTIGMLYPAIIIARIVALSTANKNNKEEEE